MRTTRWAIVLLSLIFTTGCQSISDLDREASEMIRTYWANSVGHETPTGENMPPAWEAKLSDDPSIYNTSLTTRNPKAEDLPAQTADPKTLGMDNQDYLIPDDQSDATPMDLRDILLYSIQHSRDYRGQKETLFLESLSLLREQHLWGPRFFNTFTTEFSGTPEGGDFDQVMEIMNSSRVTQRLYYGGEVSAAALVNFVSMLHDANSSTTSGSQDASLSLSASIPLLRGAGMVARESLIQAERDLIYASRRFERYRRTFLLDIASRYFDLLRQQANIVNQRRQLKSFQWLADRIEALADAGRQPKFEVQRAQQQVLFARNNLLNAAESYERVLDSFKLIIGMPTDEPLKVAAMEILIPEPELDIESSVAVALTNRLDLQTAADQVDDAQRGVKVAKNGLLGDLDLEADLTLRTDSDKRRAGADVSLEDSSYSVGISYDAPIDRKRELIDYRSSLITLERNFRDHIELRDSITLDVRASIRRIQQSRSTLLLQQQNITMSEKRLRGVVLRLRSLGPRDFIEAEGDLLEAQNRVDSAVRDLRVNILRYLVDTGQMRVTAEGQWMPPAKLVPIPGNPPIMDKAEQVKDAETIEAEGGNPDLDE